MFAYGILSPVLESIIFPLMFWAITAWNKAV
jgi:hypothetical protein